MVNFCRSVALRLRGTAFKRNLEQALKEESKENRNRLKKVGKRQK